VAALYFAVTGLEVPPGTILPLLQLLCGLDSSSSYAYSPLSVEDKELSKPLLNIVIAEWPIIGDTDANGLRESFMLREGVLIITDENASLQIQRKNFDVLIDQLPWSISYIKFAWMQKPLIVSW
jgi:hypothetical protein